MKTLTATDTRKNWFVILKDLFQGHKSYRITSKEGCAILLSEDDYESMIETLEILSTPGFLASNKLARGEIRLGKFYSIDEVWKE